MSEISTDLIKTAVYNLCFKANTCLDEKIYTKILNAYNSSTQNEIKNILKSILQNSKIAYENKMPLCQDTGQVIVFIELGQNVKLVGGNLDDVINCAIEKCYLENFFRLSVVKNAVFDRNNTKTNTPAIIYTKIVQGEEIKISVLIKGAGSENKSRLEMMLPTISKSEIVENVGDLILSAGENACPPMFIGIGIGGTSDKACLMSKECFVEDDFSLQEKELALKINDYVNLKSPKKYGINYVLDVKLKTSSTHIACMPVAITINCHSDRVSSCTIKGNNIIYKHKIPDFKDFDEDNFEIKEIFADDVSGIRDLKQGEKILLSGEIYVARDMAHKYLIEMIKKGEKLPIDVRNKIIFYAGPCPNKDGEVIGSIGPTTASRMDKYAIELYKMGLIATIGKGARSIEVENVIKSTKSKYLTVTGGIASLLAKKVKKSEIIAFQELGTEAYIK
jgi:fumarate hydratase class I